MKKALVNYWVDLVTGVAFILCALTGVVFLFPAAVHTAVGSTPTILLIPATWWHGVHDWSGVALVVGTALHLALHAKWIAVMTRKVFGAPAGASAARTGRSARLPGKAAQPAAGVAAVAAAPGDSPSGAPLEAAGELQRLERRWDARRREDERRHTRKAFLTGGAALVGAALLVLLGVAGRDAVSGPLDRSGEQASSGGTGYGDSAQTDDSGYGSGAQDSSAGAGSTSPSGGTAGASGNSSSGGAATARVAVDSGSCVGCGACLQVCPVGVFTASGGVATAQNPDACQMCGRCIQVCRPGAITLNG